MLIFMPICPAGSIYCNRKIKHINLQSKEERRPTLNERKDASQRLELPIIPGVHPVKNAHDIKYEMMQRRQLPCPIQNDIVIVRR